MPAGIVQSLVGGGNGVDDEIIDLALLLRLHPIIGIECAAGAIATSTYDTFRIVGLNAGVIPMDEALDFGYRLSGQVAPGAMQDAMGDQMNGAVSNENKPAAQSHPAVATLLGYLYHFWNGMMFSLAYLILFGSHRWWLLMPFMALVLPVLYMVLVIYSGMVVVMGVHSTGSFILEAIGHAAFGATLGVVSWAYLQGNAGRAQTTIVP